MEGRLLATFRSKIGICMAILTVIYASNVATSTWKGESFRIFTQAWLKSLTAFLVAGALVITFRQCRTALNSIGWGAAIASVIANLTGHAEGDRLVAGRGTLGNSNELAFIMLLGLPFIWLMVADREAAKVKRLLAFALSGSMIYALVRSGSRAGFIGLCLLCLMLFIRVSIVGKVALLLGGLAMGAAVVTAFPAVVERYKTVFLGSDAVSEAKTALEAGEINSAVLSAQARRKLLMDSLKVSEEHPLTGVGIGAFGSYMAAIELARGENPHYQGTHNTYTQVSSEAGVPALICFLGIIVFSFLGLRRVYKRARRSQTNVGRQVSNVTFALLATLTAYSVCVFFDFVAYDATLPLLAGFATALTHAAGGALNAAEGAIGDGQTAFSFQQPLPAFRSRHQVLEQRRPA
jgi:O-antigen ligase